MRRDVLIACLLLFALYGATVCPTVHWLDTGELTAGAFFLSVPHPPGEPVWVLLAKGAALFPLGDVPQRVAWLSAAAMAAMPCVIVFFSRMWGLSDGRGRPPWLLVAAVAPCVTYPLWVQAVRPEVYSLHLALTLTTVSLLGAAGRERPRPWMLAALTGGLAAGVHPLLAALVIVPAIGLAALTRGLPRGSALGATAAMALLGLASYLALPVRVAAGAWDAWGQPSTPEAFLNTVLARTFQQNFISPTAALLAENLRAQAETIAQGTGWLIPLVALLGLGMLLRRKQFRLAGMSGLIIGATLWAKLTQSMVFSTNVDLHGYLAIIHVALWLLAGVGVAGLLARAPLSPKLARWLPAAVLGIIAGIAALTQAADASRAGNDLARRHTQAGFEAVAPGGTFITSGNNTMFVSLYLQGVEGYRPDVRAVHRSLVGHPWYRQRWQAAPRPAALSWVDAARGRPASLAGLGGAVVLEARERDLIDAPWLCPVGPDAGWGYYGVVAPGSCPQGSVEGPARGLAAHWGPFPGDVDARLVNALAADVLERYRRAVALPPP